LRVQGLPADKKFDYLKSYGGQIKELEALIPLISKKVGMVFTDEPIF
jgi:hypothetical protein